MEESDKFWDSLNRYYSLKQEDNEKDNSKCVICHQNGSTIFSIEVDKNRKLKINCNNANSCSLEIIIPPFSLLTKELSLHYEMIETLQNKIIQIKNELIFGYATEEETVDTFRELKGRLNDTITRSQQLFQLLVEIKPDETKIDECKIQRHELISLYKSSIMEYKSTKSVIVLEKAIIIYKDIVSKNDEIMKLSYLYNSVEQINDQYKLIQRELPIDDIELIDLELVKRVNLNKYIQNDTTNQPFKVYKLLEPEIFEDAEIFEEMPEFEDAEIEMPELEDSPSIKIKIIPEEDQVNSPILDSELQRVNDLIERNPKTTDKKILEKYVTNFFFKKEEGRCLSNFWECDIIIEDEHNREYNSGECCFHGEKFYRLGMMSQGKRKEDLLKYSKKFLKGICKEKGDAVKKQGRGFILTPEELEVWTQLSIDVQKEICKYKYENYEEVRTFLCESNKILIHPALRCNEEQLKKKIWEGKAVVLDGELVVIGKNMLGNLWMELRRDC